MDFKTVIDSIDCIPPSPLILKKLEALIEDEDLIPLDILSLIKLDPALTAQTIQFSIQNSKKKPESLESAVLQVDYTAFLNFLKMLIFKSKLYPKGSIFTPHYHNLWERSFTLAIFLEALATFFPIHPRFAYTLGIMSSLGQIILILEKNLSFKMIQTINNLDAYTTESTHFMQLTASIFNKWQFQSIFVDPVHYCVQPHLAIQEEKITYLLGLATQSSFHFNNKTKIETTLIHPETGLTMEMFLQAYRNTQKVLKDTVYPLIKTF